jgi:Undecaprenyl-phosphate glucose phosphotransferase
MILRLAKYQVYLRTLTYLLPAFAFLIAAGIRIAVAGPVDGYLAHLSEYLKLAGLTTTLWIPFAGRYRLCRVEDLFRQRTSMIMAALACCTTYAMVGFALFLTRETIVSRWFIVISCAVLWTSNVAMRIAFRKVIRQGSGRRHRVRVVIVGTDNLAMRAARRLRRAPLTPCCVVAYIRLPRQEVRVHDAPIREFNAVDAIDPTAVDDIILAVPLEQVKDLPNMVASLQRLCKPIRAVVDIGDRLVIRDRTWQFGRLQVIDLVNTCSESLQYVIGKRVFDLCFAALALTILAPFMIAIAIGIKMTSKGPVFFRQDRIGLNGRVFRMLKFRTMHVTPVAESDITWTVANDPRRTALGVFLRRTSLDELPQFWNVLMGDMSVVGPRPERPHFVKKFRQDLAKYESRHVAKGGITGWAQVNGLRGDTSIAKRVEYDLEYIRNWSMMFDLKIILMTVTSGLVNKNAI